MRRWLENLSDGFVERTGVRPVGALVFGLSIFALVQLNDLAGTRTPVPAVGDASAVEAPAYVASVVEEVHVSTGDIVEAGAPIATLSSRFLDRELALIDAEIERVRARGELEQLQALAELGTEERRARSALIDADRRAREAEARLRYQQAVAELTQTLRDQIEDRVDARLVPISSLDELALSAETEEARARFERQLEEIEEQLLARSEEVHGDVTPPDDVRAAFGSYYEAELQTLRVQRQLLRERADQLVVNAPAAGRIERVVPVGTSIAEGGSVASIRPETATEIVAYVEPAIPHDAITEGDEVVLAAAGDGPVPCRANARVLRRGADVVEAPPHMRNLFRMPVFGRPVFVDVPEGCKLGVGQTLSVEFAFP